MHGGLRAIISHITGVCGLGRVTARLWVCVQSVSGKGRVALCLPWPGCVSLPSPGQADLHGIPQLVGQVVRADAIGEALRQEHGQQPGERWGGSPGSHPSAPISTSGFRCEGPGKSPPAAPPGLPLQASVGGSAAAPGRPRAELLGAQDISHPEALLSVLQQMKRGHTTLPAPLRRLQRDNLPPPKGLLLLASQPCLDLPGLVVSRPSSL